MRKTALLLALLLLLSSCGAPVQEPPEPSAAKPSAVPWEGRGECYTEETYSSPENVWANCSAASAGPNTRCRPPGTMPSVSHGTARSYSGPRAAPGFSCA